jgi:hypothetical protein
MSLTQWLQAIPAAGGASVLAYVVTALMKGWLVPGYIYERERRRGNDMLNAVLASTDAAKLALQTSLRRQADEDDTGAAGR